MSVRKERKDLFYALKGRIQGKIDYYNSPEVTSTCSQPARVCGRKEGYQEVLDMIDEMLQIDVMV